MKPEGASKALAPSHPSQGAVGDSLVSSQAGGVRACPRVHRYAC